MIDRVEGLLQVKENDSSVFSFIYIQVPIIGAGKRAVVTECKSLKPD